MPSSSLAEQLRLTSHPVAITFVDAPPPGVPHVSALEPAGCGYWRRAAEGEVFYTVADDHKGCPVGAHTHNVPLSPEEQQGLMGLVQTMVDLSYLKMEEVPSIPTRRTPLQVAVYAPLDRAPVAPDLVLVRGNARQLMLLTEAAQAAGVAGTSAPMGRPTCAVVPESLNSARTAASFGCVGNRVYTGADENEAYFAIPGPALAAIEASLAVIVRANSELEGYHRGRVAARGAGAMALALAAVLLGSATRAAAQPATMPSLLADRVDVSTDFRDFANEYYVADTLVSFDPATASGTLKWQRNSRYPRLAFNYIEGVLRPFPGVIFPEKEYDVDPVWPFTLHFVSPRTVRIRVKTGPTAVATEPSLMLAGEPATDKSWQYGKVEGGHRYTSSAGSLTVLEKPWRIELRDAAGTLLTKTQNPADFENTLSPALPFSFIRRAADHSRSIAGIWSLSPGEKLFGGGESFTRLDKRGQRLVLSVNDANGAESERMYKPIPFLMSSRGYGLFTHTSAPVTFDVGATFHGSNALLLGDDELDLFAFLGTPKQVLDEYTDVTGKSPMPPLWSFGFWMSRITYLSEEEVRGVATKLRQNRIPADLIHIDTGWFETDWRSDYQFSKKRFPDPAKMIADLKRDGFHVSLWQLPYFVPKNLLFPEIVGQGLAIRDGKGNLPSEDAVLDFSNPKTITWYQDKLGALLKMGVGAIKVDFGEAAPFNGVYASGRSGFYEHNLYPLRYNKVVADVTREVNKENLIWARSAWAGSQRYPLHWGGDAATTDIGMASTLLGGLSFGLSGFTFWSHDIGGFMGKTTEDLYARWLPFGLLTSHSRSHGFPPREPWEFGDAFTNAFRRVVEMRYKLMPYVYAQAKDSSARGLPMLRALFIEFPEDAGAWMVEDEYLFGSDILVAPLLETGTKGRDVYLPGGSWIDYQTGRAYAAGWHRIEAGEIPVVMLVREGAAIPHIAVAQSTATMDWSKLEVEVFAATAAQAAGLVALPDGDLTPLTLARRGATFAFASAPLAGKVTWTIRRRGEARQQR